MNRGVSTAEDSLRLCVRCPLPDIGVRERTGIHIPAGVLAVIRWHDGASSGTDSAEEMNRKQSGGANPCAGCATRRIGSNLNGGTNRFGWLQATEDAVRTTHSLLSRGGAVKFTLHIGCWFFVQQELGSLHPPLVMKPALHNSIVQEVRHRQQTHTLVVRHPAAH